MITLLNAATATNSPPVNVNAFGSVVAVSGANTADGDYFTIWDGLNSIRFEFDSNSSVTATDVLRPIVFTGVETASQMGDLIVTALAASTLARTTGSNSSGTVTVTKTYPGPAGNGRITENVTNGSFAVTSFHGGAFVGFSLRREGPPAQDWNGLDLGILQLRFAGSGALDCTIAIWGFAEGMDRFVLMGSMNDGTSMTATTAGTRSESVRGLSAYSRIYAEIVAISGTNNTVTLQLQQRNL